MSEGESQRARGFASLERGDTAGGITDLKAHLASDPDDAPAWIALGVAYLTIDHLVQAADALRAAVDLDGANVDARLHYARALVRLKKLDDAAFQLLQASKVDANDARVAKELGIVFYEKRLYEKAATWLAKASALDPSDARAAYALGLAHEARRDMAAAIAQYREALRRDPKLAPAYKTLADALASMGEHEQAIAELDALLALERSNEQAAHNRAVLERALEEMKKQRLLGKTKRELEASALVGAAEFKDKGEVPPLAAGETTRRYMIPLVELYASFAGEAIQSLMLVLTHPSRAAEKEDEIYKVTIVGEGGEAKRADLGTGATLTFLREALGCPMTKASELYARLLSGEKQLEWGGATIEFASVPRHDKPSETRHGVRVAMKR